jgi:hypothetical protein
MRPNDDCPSGARGDRGARVLEEFQQVLPPDCDLDVLAIPSCSAKVVPSARMEIPAPPSKGSPSMTPPDEAQQLIEEHIATLDEHKASLERALSHLNGTAGDEGRQQRARQGRGQGQGAGRTAQTGRNGGARPQAPRGARRAEVIADLEANPGSKPAEVASRVGINPNHAQTILANLTKQGVVTKEGQQYTVAVGKA